MTSPSDVRLAVPEDRDSIIHLCHTLHDENGLFSLSDRKVFRLVDRYFARQNAIIGVIGPIGNVEGSIYLAVEEPYYSEDLQLCEFWNIVHPEHRKSGHAKKLISFAKRCSDSTHLCLMIGIISNHRTAAKVRLYEKQLQPAGAFFVHNPQYAGGHWAEAAE